MSSEELVHPPELPAEFGGAKRHNKKKVIVVGKVYANWCGHCKSLKPEWKKMKKRVYSRRGNKQVVFEEIEEKQMTNKLPKLKKHHGVDIDVNGFPTVFKIENGKVEKRIKLSELQVGMIFASDLYTENNNIHCLLHIIFHFYLNEV
jgi:thiol-disulfide isomerase/thioredoxin